MGLFGPNIKTGRVFDPIIAYNCDEKGQVATINLKEVGSCQSIYHFSAYLPPTLLHGTIINQDHTYKGRAITCKMHVEVRSSYCFGINQRHANLAGWLTLSKEIMEISKEDCEKIHNEETFTFHLGPKTVPSTLTPWVPQKLTCS